MRPLCGGHHVEHVAAQAGDIAVSLLRKGRDDLPLRWRHVPSGCNVPIGSMPVSSWNSRGPTISLFSFQSMLTPRNRPCTLLPVRCRKDHQVDKQHENISPACLWRRRPSLFEASRGPLISERR
jgi:hypothetical protein